MSQKLNSKHLGNWMRTLENMYLHGLTDWSPLQEQKKSIEEQPKRLLICSDDERMVKVGEWFKNMTGMEMAEHDHNAERP